MHGDVFMVEPTAEEFAKARARGEARMRGPRAEIAHYDAGRNRIIVRLTTGVELGFAPRDVEGLQRATVDDLKAIEVEAFGLGIRFLKLDADLYVPALLEGVLGSKRWMGSGWRTRPERRKGRRFARERQAWRQAAAKRPRRRPVGRSSLIGKLRGSSM